MLRDPAHITRLLHTGRHNTRKPRSSICHRNSLNPPERTPTLQISSPPWMDLLFKNSSAQWHIRLKRLKRLKVRLIYRPKPHNRPRRFPIWLHCWVTLTANHRHNQTKGIRMLNSNNRSPTHILARRPTLHFQTMPLFHHCLAILAIDLRTRAS